MFDYIHDLIQWCHARREKFFDAVMLYIEQSKREVNPIYDTDIPSDISIQPYIVNYNDRKHIFAYNPSTTAITLSDATGEWNTSLPASSWTNISFPQSTRLKATTGTGVVIKIKCTDEMVP